MRAIGEKAAARSLDAVKMRNDGMTYKEIGAAMVNERTGELGISATMARALVAQGKMIINGDVAVGKITALQGALNCLSPHLSRYFGIVLDDAPVDKQKELVRKLLTQNSEEDVLKIKNMGPARLAAIRKWLG